MGGVDGGGRERGQGFGQRGGCAGGGQGLSGEGGEGCGHGVVSLVGGGPTWRPYQKGDRGQMRGRAGLTTGCQFPQKQNDKRLSGEKLGVRIVIK